MRRCLWPLLVLFLGGCAPGGGVLKNAPSSYRDGYEKGCERAKMWFVDSLAEEARPKPALYRTDPRFKEGYDAGFDDCYEEKELEIWMERPFATVR